MPQMFYPFGEAKKVSENVGFRGANLEDHQ
jgi:hypothetical protein